ncbi:MAG: NADH-quinone oxidoreductase subunit J [Elusimicrobia bacterium]|nr:NADH-quinone oxidoreductase subunit J [Elusimicrobiota bacterium]
MLFAVLLVFQKTLYGSAICLLAVLLQVAAMFFAWGAELLGLMQVMVYAGAIMVLVVIATMTGPTRVERPWARSRAGGWLGAVVLGALFLELLSLGGPAAPEYAARHASKERVSQAAPEYAARHASKEGVSQAAPEYAARHASESGAPERAMAELLFGSQALATEAVGVLILVAALAVVALPGLPLGAPGAKEPS